ncbi:F-box/WD repeat-containing protein [Sporobolomyces koalae]|uniref:F-box/WD repeat-containing protein n=1 Tax=Sporobolomyces koalae TaxID=500713 RepID=UPI0031762770
MSASSPYSVPFAPSIPQAESPPQVNSGSPPLTPTPSALHHTLVSTAAARISQVNAIRPPTPAPSPQPRSRAGTHESHAGPSAIPVGAPIWRSPNEFAQPAAAEGELVQGTASASGRSLTEAEIIDSLREQINSLLPASRQLLLTHLIHDSAPSALSPLVHLITPRLKRDFLKTLPVELAFHVLSFVDEVKTLARASEVSRFWRALLEDEATWKRMCWKSGFGNAPVPPSPASLTVALDQYQFGKMRSLEFGTPEQWNQEDEMFTPAGRERRGTLDRVALSEFAARAELFDLPVAVRRGSRSARAPDNSMISEAARDESDRAREREGSWSDAPTTQPTHDELQTSHTGLGIAAASVSNVGGLADRRGTRSVPAVLTSQQSLPRRRASALESTPNDLSRNLPTQHRQFSLPGHTSTLVSPPMFSLPTNSPSGVQPMASSSSNPGYSDHVPLPSSSTLTAETPVAASQASSAAPSRPTLNPFSYKTHFKRAYLTESNWLRGPGRLLSTQMSADDGVVTSLGFDEDWIIVGMATSKVHVFEAGEGRYVRTLEGHELGVWCLTLVSRGGGKRTAKSKSRADNREDEILTGEAFTAHGRSSTDFFGTPPQSSSSPNPRRRRSFPSASTPSSPAPAPVDTSSNKQTKSGGMGLGAGGPTGDSSQQSGVCSTARGWGQEGAIVVSGGCDREVRVWDVETGKCLHTLRGHTSTVRCMRVLDGRPIAVSGSRDSTLRVWDIEKGECLHLLSGHTHSVRCIEVSGNKVVSGSYDATCRLWDIETGQCLHVFRGHIHQIYAVAFDGIRVVTGSLDSTVRIWSAETGEFLALLQGHTSLVGQLVLLPSAPSAASNMQPGATLVTGGSDGRVIVFDMTTFETVHRLCAHDNSVTCLQVDDRFIVTGGNDGRIKLWDFRSGLLIRELSEPCGAVWRVVFRDDKCVTLCRRDGKTLMDVRTFRPSEEELFGEGQH